MFNLDEAKAMSLSLSESDVIRLHRNGTSRVLTNETKLGLIHTLEQYIKGLEYEHLDTLRADAPEGDVSPFAPKRKGFANKEL